MKPSDESDWLTQWDMGAKEEQAQNSKWSFHTGTQSD